MNSQAFNNAGFQLWANQNSILGYSNQQTSEQPDCSTSAIKYGRQESNLQYKLIELDLLAKALLDEVFTSKSNAFTSQPRPYIMKHTIITLYVIGPLGIEPRSKD